MLTRPTVSLENFLPPLKTAQGKRKSPAFRRAFYPI